MSKPTGDSRSLQTYSRLWKEQQAAKAKLDKIKAQLAEVEPRVLDFFQKSGVPRMTVRGVTIYTKRDLWAGREEGITNEVACEALAKAGLGDFAAMRFNTQTLSAYVRECEKNEEPLPEEFKGVIKVSETFKIQARKG